MTYKCQIHVTTTCKLGYPIYRQAFINKQKENCIFEEIPVFHPSYRGWLLHESNHVHPIKLIDSGILQPLLTFANIKVNSQGNHCEQQLHFTHSENLLSYLNGLQNSNNSVHGWLVKYFRLTRFLQPRSGQSQVTFRCCSCWGDVFLS